MPIKGVILSDHVQINKYQLTVIGMPPMLFTAMSGIEEELDQTELPDRTSQTGGRTKPGTFDLTQPMHHTLERFAMEAWFSECKDPVSPLHKKIGTVLAFSQSNANIVSYMLQGLYPQKRALPDFEMDNDGEMGTIVWTMHYDEVLLLS